MDNITQKINIENIKSLTEADFAYDKIIEKLSREDTEDFVKIFSIINLSEIKSEHDFKIIIKHLTNHPTPIREILALKLDEFGSIYENYYLTSKEQLLSSIIDINPNVSRAICSVLLKSQVLKEEIEYLLILKIENLLEEIKIYEQNNSDFFDNKLKNRKNHAKNKKLFSLYWLLEALSIVISNRFLNKITEILRTTINFSDYTIREKTAKILVKMPDAPCELIDKIALDQNFYVKNQVYDKISFED